MNIDNLTAFVEIATNNKSFSHTAESSQLSAPDVCKRVVELEAELSTKLFGRIGHNIHLTEAGQALLPSAHQISEEWSRVEKAIGKLGAGVSDPRGLGASEHKQLAG